MQGRGLTSITKRLSWLPPVSEMSSYFSPRLFSFSSITGFLPCLVRIGPCCFTFCKQRGRVWFSQGFVTNGPGIAPKTPALDHVGGGQDWKELSWCPPPGAFPPQTALSRCLSSMQAAQGTFWDVPCPPPRESQQHFSPLGCAHL